MIRAVTFHYRNTPNFAAERNKPLSDRAMKQAMLQWHRRIAPEHFTTAAVGRYGYQKRAKGYQIRKARRFGHTRPLVYRGRLRAEVLRRIRVMTYRYKRKSKIKGSMHGRVLNFYAPGRVRSRDLPDLRAEIVAVTDAEVARLARWVRKGLRRQWRRAARGHRTVRVA